jgi:thiol-disulfide isomerase/thioredoxin
LRPATLFSARTAKRAEADAARSDALPPVTKDDIKAVLTGVAVVDSQRRHKHDEAVFVPPETKLEVPYGKTVLFRVEYDFPEGYGARVWVRDSWPNEQRRNSYYFGSNPSGNYTGKGTAYGFLSLLDRGKSCRLEKVVVRTQSDPELDEWPRGWEISEAAVDLDFKEKPEDWEAQQDAAAPEVSKSVPKGWIEDFEAAKQQAAKEGKLILMDFSGSDWCGWCRKMDAEVFTKDRFVREASKKFVLVSVDSPRDKSILSALARKQNSALAEKYEVRGYPTVVIVDPDGKEVKRHSGYRAGGPNGYLKYLRELTRRAKWPQKAH